MTDDVSHRLRTINVNLWRLITRAVGSYKTVCLNRFLTTALKYRCKVMLIILVDGYRSFEMNGSVKIVRNHLFRVNIWLVGVLNFAGLVDKRFLWNIFSLVHFSIPISHWIILQSNVKTFTQYLRFQLSPLQQISLISAI